MSLFRIDSYDQNPDPFFVERDARAVNISETALKSVAFIGIKKKGIFQPRATAFLVAYREDQHLFSHLVTAEHVISGLITKKHDIWLRVNLTNGKTKVIPLPNPSAFHFHPENACDAADVAVCPFHTKFNDEETGEYIELDMSPLAMSGEGGFLPSDEFARESIVLGGEIAIIGLFRSHSGVNRNVPIVRVGNISALLGEPVFTNYAGYIKAYLVEARSIAGLSGSPVFVFPDSALLVAKELFGQLSKQQGSALLGLMHGHFDVNNLNEDVVSDENEPNRSVHTGIGVVIPVEKIIETIRHPDLVNMRKAIVKRLRKRGATSDLASDGSAVDASSDANPNHLEDFTRLVDVAARKRPQGDKT